MVLIDKTHYNTVTSIAFSPCGEYFICGNIHGDLILYNLNNLLSSFDNANGNTCKIAKNEFQLSTDKNVCIHSITTWNQFIMLGLTGEIIGWKWRDVIESDNGKLPVSSWTIKIPLNETMGVVCEINSLKVGSGLDTTGNVLAGCGDNNVYSFSLEDGRLLSTYSGHTDYVHSIDLKENTIVSGSEDGSVRVWDSRTCSITNCIQPYKNKELIRPYLGDWIGDVSISEDWLICGGGTKLSLWNLRNANSPMTIFTEIHDEGIHVSQFHHDNILAGGSAPCLSILNFNDELKTGIQTSSSTIYSCALISQDNSIKALGIVGNSNSIDISTNCKYRECVVPFY